MTLQSSSSATTTTQPPTLLQTVSVQQDEVVVLDTPVSHKQHQKQKKTYSTLGDCPNSPVSFADSEAASPSVSAVIDALHLSDIDWDALSFTSSPPPPQTAPNPTTDTKPSESANEKGNTKLKTSSDIKQAETKAAPELCYTECPLRDRVLMRNTAKAINQTDIHNDVVSKQLNYELPSLECVSSHKLNLKLNAQMSIKDSDDSKLSGKESAVKKELPTDKGQCVMNKAETKTHTSTQQPLLAAQALAPSKTKDTKKPTHKYKFVRTAILSSAAPPQTCHSDPGHSNKDRNMPQTTKKSVCMSVCSSSEDSDVENRQLGPQRKTKIKVINKNKDSFHSDFPLKPVSNTRKPTANTAHSVQLLGPRPQRQSVDVINVVPASTKSKCQDVPAVSGHDDVYLQTPASPVIVLDSDDSLICSESPLPLAERLRLKFQK